MFIFLYACDSNLIIFNLSVIGTTHKFAFFCEDTRDFPTAKNVLHLRHVKNRFVNGFGLYAFCLIKILAFAVGDKVCEITYLYIKIVLLLQQSGRWVHRIVSLWLVYHRILWEYKLCEFSWNCIVEPCKAVSRFSLAHARYRTTIRHQYSSFWICIINKVQFHQSVTVSTIAVNSQSIPANCCAHRELCSGGRMIWIENAIKKINQTLIHLTTIEWDRLLINTQPHNCTARFGIGFN